MVMRLMTVPAAAQYSPVLRDLYLELTSPPVPPSTVDGQHGNGVRMTTVVSRRKEQVKDTSSPLGPPSSPPSSTKVLWSIPP
ncbi:unnamed protein product [Calypogeia fissa]